MRHAQGSRSGFVVSAFLWGAGLALDSRGHHVLDAALGALRALALLVT